MNLGVILFIFLFIFSILMFLGGVNFILMDLVYFVEFNIMNLNSCSIVMTVLFDWKSLFFLSTVLFISSFIMFYSKNYMSSDLMFNRFIMLMILFVFSMILLIISPNLISILLGWDGLGLISYCLVIYYQNLKSFNAGMITVLSNRIGDVALLMSIAWMLNFGSWNYIFYVDFLNNDKIMVLITILVVFASFTKSAQIPFSSWLPAAMAAPTPVSSLVHSSTLVTAGVYLLIRFENLFYNSNYKFWFLLISSLTMFMAGLSANFEFDLKKIIALSTLSQLGMMMSILFMGFKDLSFFHLLMHAFFKALLFMCAGILIHNMSDLQDVRMMGSICSQLPLISICFNFSNLALCGFPFLSGFYSKDLILEMMFMLNFNMFIILILIISSMLTVSYTFRLIYFSMIGSFKMFSLNLLSDSFSELNKSLLGLIFMVIFSGSMMSWIMFPLPYMVCLPIYMKLMPIYLIFIGLFLGYYFYFLTLNLIKIKFYNLIMFFSMMWFLPIISTYGMIKNFLLISKFLMFYNDQGWTEFYLGQGYLLFLNKFSSLVDLLYFYFNNIINLMFIFMLMLYFYLNLV
uniref:NADH-ubiquinone oxidoreductase chain 5 n=1 Tax=Cimbex luteus TaxID=1384799 RepID=A0A7T1FUJ5_9HYME|nr:NADH dehydrogenase subunit 5 [Cimbex luteus]QPM99421.1 NADH dehydrogenase subunit 5 [Cimbex luteus]UXW64284.1 NADH dehydrogenase subunit 5 [Cimbex luteus]